MLPKRKSFKNLQETDETPDADVGTNPAVIMLDNDDEQFEDVVIEPETKDHSVVVQENKFQPKLSLGRRFMLFISCHKEKESGAAIPLDVKQAMK